MRYYTNILTTFDGIVVEKVYTTGSIRGGSRVEKENERWTRTERRSTSSLVISSSERLPFVISGYSRCVRSAVVGYVKYITHAGFRRFLIWYYDRV
jgi:hypothetical protein